MCLRFGLALVVNRVQAEKYIKAHMFSGSFVSGYNTHTHFALWHIVGKLNKAGILRYYTMRNNVNLFPGISYRNESV